MAKRWRDELAAKIADPAGEDWDETFFVNPATDALVPLRRKGVTVGVGWTDRPPPSACGLVGCVNADEFAGAPPGTLLLSHWDWDAVSGENKAGFVLSPRSWNVFLFPDGQWGELRGADGSLPFKPADFNLIPGA